MDSLIVQMGVLLLSLLLLWGGAEGLVRGSSSLALRLGVPPLIVGLTIVAFGTSLPELLVNVRSVLVGQGDIAVANVVGSNIFNVCIILGISALARPLKVQLSILRFDLPILLLVSFLGVALLWDRALSRSESGFLILGMAVYVASLVRRARQEPEASSDEFTIGAQTALPPVISLISLGGGLALLVVGSRLLVDSSVFLSRHFGVSEAVIGLTIVAAGTSMPELATSLVAALRRQDDISIGNIVGSNIFNLLGILGITGMIMPVSAPGITPTDFFVMLLASALLVPLMRSGMILRRWEGAVFVAIYLGYLWQLWPATLR
jgi:cation:H+ antiporter